MSIQTNFPAIKPTLLLDFANVKALDPRITFTRASTATYIDQFGAMQTAASGVARFDHNPTTLESLGLLIEEQRTNLVLNSAALATQNVTVTAVAHTLSFYGTGTVTLSGVSTSGPLVGTGAFPRRVTLTFTPTAGTLTLTVSGSVLLAQLEVGSFATSYIPTVASQVTRPVDAASMTGTNFSSWYNQAGGTVYSEASTFDASTIRSAFSASDGTTTFRVLTAHGTGARGFVANSGTQMTQAIASVAFSSNTFSKISMAYAVNNGNVAANGTLGTLDTAMTIPVVTQLQIGSQTGSVTQTLNGTIKKIAYYPLRVTDAQLQALTS
jgi:hypothetical protein